MSRATDGQSVSLIWPPTDIAIAGLTLLLRPGTPVLFTSGYTDGEIERRGLLRSEAAFLQKPFTPEALVRAWGGSWAGKGKAGNVR